MFCCKNCFSSNYLKEIIEGQGQIGNCDFCNSSDTPLISPGLLFPLFQGILSNFYRDDESASVLVPLLEEVFPVQIFSQTIPERKELLLKSIITEEAESFSSIFEGTVSFRLEKENNTKNTWENFKREIKEENRYHIKNALNLDMLEKQFSKSEVSQTIPKGAIYYRARISENYGFEIKDMGNPPAAKAKAGRANPAGISYLYVADQLETTLYEARASLLDFVTIGEFRVNEELKVLNLRDNTSLDLFRWAESEEVEVYMFIFKLQEELSKPYRNNDQDIDYIPTQYICEFIKSLGYDGVEYQSSLFENGYNLAIFKPDKLSCINTQVREIKKIDYLHTKRLRC